MLCKRGKRAAQLNFGTKTSFGIRFMVYFWWQNCENSYHGFFFGGGVVLNEILVTSDFDVIHIVNLLSNLLTQTVIQLLQRHVC